MQQRRDTAANWTAANPTLASGEIGVETDTLRFKVGNGTTAWSSLAYVGLVTSVAGRQGIVTLDHRDIGNLPTTLSQFTANQNDLALGTGGIIRISSDAARDITGFAGGTSGDARLLVNVGSFAITLRHQSTSSAAANRIIGVSSADVQVPSQGSVVVFYDGTDSRWRAG
jgi:hypothetical protein